MYQGIAVCTSVIIVNCRHLCKFYHVYDGLPKSLDWTSGLDWWTGLVDWTDGLTLKLILCFVTTRGAVWKPCSLLSVNPCANNLLH